MSDFTYWSFIIILGYFISDYVIFAVASLLFMIIMPAKNKWGHLLIAKVIIFIPFILGYALDIIWSVFHFTRRLYFMNEKSKLDYSVRPKFRNLALTPRLQDILDVYPRTSKAYGFAHQMAVFLNKFDALHLNPWRGVPQ